MDRTQRIDEELNALSAHLAGRREALLQAWTTAVAADPELSTASSLPRTQFYDHIPDILDSLERRLRSWPDADSASSRAARKEDAGAHGLQRWQQGYQLREVTREWGHLHMCVADEIESYALHKPDVDPQAMAIARRAVLRIINEGVSESTAQYFHLRQIEAAGYVRDLEQALEQLRELEAVRAELWRQAAHDLRGNLGVVVNATSGLARAGAGMEVRDEFLRMLQRSVASLHSMLDDVMSLAQLQAGQETREIKAFDAAATLTELCDALRPMAREHGLYLQAEGPGSLPVEGDPVKTRRIAQNLLLNAIRYTRQGGVTVSWGDSRENDPDRWMLCVEDTGPGFHAGPGAPLVGALEAATEEARQVEARADESAGTHDEARAERSADTRPVNQERGEGIGLSIVKRLCELLDAALELESTPAKGTTFRVVLPRHYGKGGRA
jgi:signal transduction histidine kinase